MSKNKPDGDYRYFLLDPLGEGMLFFRSAQERDDAAKECIESYLDEDGWYEEVTRIITGCVTGHAVARYVEFKPLRSEFETDEEYKVALDETCFYEYDDHDYRCEYELMDIGFIGENTKR